MRRRFLSFDGGARISPTGAAAAGINMMRVNLAEAVVLAVDIRSRRKPHVHRHRRGRTQPGHEPAGTRPASSRHAGSAGDRREGDAGRESSNAPSVTPARKGRPRRTLRTSPATSATVGATPYRASARHTRKLVSLRVCTTSSAVGTPKHSQCPDRRPPEPARTRTGALRARRGTPVPTPRPGTPAVLGRAGSAAPRWRHDRRATATR